MKNQGTGTRKQGAMPSAADVQDLVRRAVSPVGGGAEPERDLWPVMLRRIEGQPTHTPAISRAIPWVDWALAGALFLLVAISPRLVPVLLYYL